MSSILAQPVIHVNPLAILTPLTILAACLCDPSVPAINPLYACIPAMSIPII